MLIQYLKRMREIEKKIIVATRKKNYNELANLSEQYEEINSVIKKAILVRLGNMNANEIEILYNLLSKKRLVPTIQGGNTKAMVAQIKNTFFSDVKQMNFYEPTVYINAENDLVTISDITGLEESKEYVFNTPNFQFPKSQNNYFQFNYESLGNLIMYLKSKYQFNISKDIEDKIGKINPLILKLENMSLTDKEYINFYAEFMSELSKNNIYSSYGKFMDYNFAVIDSNTPFREDRSKITNLLYQDSLLECKSMNLDDIKMYIIKLFKRYYKHDFYYIGDLNTESFDSFNSIEEIINDSLNEIRIKKQAALNGDQQGLEQKYKKLKELQYDYQWIKKIISKNNLDEIKDSFYDENPPMGIEGSMQRTMFKAGFQLPIYTKEEVIQRISFTVVKSIDELITNAGYKSIIVKNLSDSRVIDWYDFLIKNKIILFNYLNSIYNDYSNIEEIINELEKQHEKQLRLSNNQKNDMEVQKVVAHSKKLEEKLGISNFDELEEIAEYISEDVKINK